MIVTIRCRFNISGPRYDCDGVLFNVDCDDTDTAYGNVGFDRDCDLILTADDCNDLDASSTTKADDGIVMVLKLQMIAMIVVYHWEISQMMPIVMGH